MTSFQKHTESVVIAGGPPGVHSVPTKSIRTEDKIISVRYISDELLEDNVDLTSEFSIPLDGKAIENEEGTDTSDGYLAIMFVRMRG